MNSILADLWYGNVTPCENCGVGDAEVERLVKCMGEQEDTLLRALQAPQKELFTRYVRWSDMYASAISEKAFQEGFRLAVRLMSEIVPK